MVSVPVGSVGKLSRMAEVGVQVERKDGKTPVTLSFESDKERERFCRRV